MDKLLDIFAEKKLVLAQGCTEPGAVAFAVAAAAEHSLGEVKKIRIKIDGFVYKNGMSTGLPGINKYYVNKTAAALGYFADNPLEKKLTFLADLEDKLDQALEIIDRVEFEVLEDKMPVYVEAIIEADNQVRALIKGNHDDLNEIAARAADCTEARMAGAALLYLAGKEDEIESGINNLISDTSGVYCDGAKGSCALKSLTAAELALRHFDLVMQGLDCYLPSGFINCSLNKTFENLAAISQPSENTVNNTLFKVIENNANAC